MASEQAKGLTQLWQRLTELRDLRYGDQEALASWQAKARTDLQRILPDRDDAARLERIWSSRHTAAAARRLLASDFESQRSASIGLLQGAIHEAQEHWARHHRA
jgi:hypothetical protein